ncbi:ABC transporter ATP-binding protein [Candidatus Desulfarcum epimagneticum]|uniref:ABC transporter ATP-binding protein n=1 Tax=uncultured Desulfobacteraceae bacterium TaxID=218296 RepID=A0A484HM08_9BACT|nr:ABC transporter ATP-binding protein [uncultured Desulfobacteraceae bacterium]
MASNVLVGARLARKSYGAQPLFTDISLQVLEHDRMGLIGPNGAGKSTFLKILAGEVSVDSGEVSRRRFARVIYLPQNDVLDPEKTMEETLLQAIPGGLEKWRIAKRLDEIKSLMALGDGGRKVGALSGGWRKRLAIGRALLEKPDLLLMDEPTNHLDLEGILWLERLLKEAPFAFVLVSHDRFFLDATTNRMVELNLRYPGGLIKTQGSYSDFIVAREACVQKQARLETVLSNKVRREVEWLRRGPKARATKAKHRIRQAWRLQDDLSAAKGRNSRDKKVDIAFDATRRKTRELLSARKIKKTLGGKLLFENLNLKLGPGTGLGIMGQNGAGKSSLLHILNGALAPDQGSVVWAHGLRIVTFDQKRQLPDETQTLRRALAPEGDTVIYKDRPIHVAAWAKRFLFEKDQLGTPVSKLSGGEKARVLIASLMSRPADVLLLDEPANDLDIPTLQVLEESLEEFPGALVLITHDRFLMGRLCHRLLFLDGNGGAHYFADYDQWLQHRDKTLGETGPSRGAARPGGASKSMETSKSGPASPGKKSQKRAYEERKELGRIEKQIEKAEETAKSLRLHLNDPDAACDAGRLETLYAEHQEAQAKVDALYRRWEELEEGLETG